MAHLVMHRLKLPHLENAGPSCDQRLVTAVWGALVAAPLVLGAVGAVSGVRQLIAANTLDYSGVPPQFIPPMRTGLDMAEFAVRRFAMDGVAAICVVLAIYAVGWQLSRLATGRRGSTGPGPGDEATLPRVVRRRDHGAEVANAASRRLVFAIATAVSGDKLSRQQRRRVTRPA